MKKIFFLIGFLFALNVQTIIAQEQTIKKDSVAVKNIPPLGRTKEEARQLLESLRERVLKGESFATLAAQYSEDPGSSKTGGQLSAFGRGQTVPEFEEIAYSLKIGEISKVFETKYGFHFMEVLAKEGDKFLARHILLQVK